MWTLTKGTRVLLSKRTHLKARAFRVRATNARALDLRVECAHIPRKLCNSNGNNLGECDQCEETRPPDWLKASRGHSAGGERRGPVLEQKPGPFLRASRHT